jgi:hypothetical protein
MKQENVEQQGAQPYGKHYGGFALDSQYADTFMKEEGQSWFGGI